MGRQCSCLGENPSCTRCFGFGYVDELPDFHVSLDSNSQYRGPSQAHGALERSDSGCAALPDIRPPAPADLPSSQSPSIGCLYCPFRCNSEKRREEHIAAEHVADAGDSSETAQGKPLVRVDGRIFVRRVLARVERRATTIDRHAVATHTESQRCLQGVSAKPLPIASAKRIKPPLVLCPICKSPTQVPTDRLARHIRRKHGLKEAASGLAFSKQPSLTPIPSSSHAPISKVTKKTALGTTSRRQESGTSRGQSGPDSDDTEDGFSEINNHREERRLDGSRDYSQVREEGRFGSHPSYDDCDDESAP
jgi:hypothetical protein